MLETEICEKYIKVLEKIKPIKEINLKTENGFYIVTDFLPHKPITIIYRTHKIDELTFWLDAFIDSMKVYVYLQSCSQAE